MIDGKHERFLIELICSVVFIHVAFKRNNSNFPIAGTLASPYNFGYQSSPVNPIAKAASTFISYCHAVLTISRQLCMYGT